MSGSAIRMSDYFGAEKTKRAPSKQAWARYVRGRWPQNAVCHAQSEWDLSAGQARGLVFGHASQPTIDAILSHKRGGPVLALQVEALAWGDGFENFIRRVLAEQQQRLVHERERAEAEERRLATLARRIAALPAPLGALRPRLGAGPNGNLGEDLGGRPGRVDPQAD